MKKLKKIILGVMSYIFLFNKILYATTDVSNEMKNFEIIKYVLIFLGIFLVLLVLFISYKTDSKETEDVLKDDDTDDTDDTYDNIQIDEEQSLYSVIDEDLLNKEEREISNYNFTNSENFENIDDNFIVKKKEEVDEITEDFEFDDIFSELPKNNILEDYDNSNIVENVEDKIETNINNDKNVFFHQNISNESNSNLLEKEDFFVTEEPMLENTDIFFTQSDPKEEMENFYGDDNIEFFTLEEKNDNEEIKETKEKITDKKETAPKKTTRKTTKKSENKEEDKKNKKSSSKKTTTKKTTTRKAKTKKDEKEIEEKSPKKKRTTRKKEEE